MQRAALGMVALFCACSSPGTVGELLVDKTDANVTDVADRACPGLRPMATLSFLGGYVERQHGAIVAGDQLSIEYDLGRLTTCRDTHNGDRFWTLDAFAQFSPGGQLAS